MRLAIAIVVFIFIIFVIVDIISTRHTARKEQEEQWRREFDELYVGFNPEQAWLEFLKNKRKQR